MPELPEVETVRKCLERKIVGKTIKSIKIIFPQVFENQDIEFIKEKIKNQKINKMKRIGKWLIYELDDYYLLSHLRMEGKYLYRNINDKIGPHELIIFNLDNEIELRYKDTRKFGKMYFLEKKDLYNSPLSKLGKEPWDASVEYVKEKFNSKTIPIKTALLDQSILVGLGNIYADEVLFLSKINPYKKPKELNDKEIYNIIENSKKVLEKAIKEGGTTIRSYTSEEGIDGRFQNNLLVHQRENKTCYACKSIIKREKINGRSTYYCPKCQEED